MPEYGPMAHGWSKFDIIDCVVSLDLLFVCVWFYGTCQSLNSVLLGYRLHECGSFSGKGRFFALCQHVQISPGLYSPRVPMGYFSRIDVAGTWSWLPSSMKVNTIPLFMLLCLNKPRTFTSVVCYSNYYCGYKLFSNVDDGIFYHSVIWQFRKRHTISSTECGSHLISLTLYY
jgi:hypothetical protein